VVSNPKLIIISNVLIPDYMLDSVACQFMGLIIQYCELSNELSIERAELCDWVDCMWFEVIFWDGVEKRELGVECVHVLYG